MVCIRGKVVVRVLFCGMKNSFFETNRKKEGCCVQNANSEP